MADWPYNTTAWRKLRLSKLASEPLCEPCRIRGELTTANTVDHNTPVNAGGQPFPPLDGLTSMCARCHNEKTATFDKGNPKPFARRVKGFDESGSPIDPSDPWRGGGSDRQNGLGAGPLGRSEDT